MVIICAVETRLPQRDERVRHVLRLLPMSDRDKDSEILALRHQISVLERHLTGQRLQFTPGDRAFLAALLHHLPKDTL